MKLHTSDHAQRTVGRLPCIGRQVSLCATWLVGEIDDATAVTCDVCTPKQGFGYRR
jgi:hypothetical protein